MPFRHAAILAHCAGGQQPTRDRSVKNRTESRGRRGAWSSHGQPDGIAEKWLGGCSADGVTRIPRIRAGRGYAGLYRGELRENRGPQRRGAAWRTLLGSFGMGSYCGALTWVRSSVLGRNIARRDVVLLLSMVEGRACESNRARRADLVKMCLTPVYRRARPAPGRRPPRPPPTPFAPVRTRSGTNTNLDGVFGLSQSVTPRVAPRPTPSHQAGLWVRRREHGQCRRQSRIYST